MKLTQSDIEAIERLLTMHQSGMTGAQIAKEYVGAGTQFPTTAVSALRKIGVKIPSNRAFNGFNQINSQELAEFRAWKAAKEATP